jgi:hypothetical protein
MIMIPRFLELAGSTAVLIAGALRLRPLVVTLISLVSRPLDSTCLRVRAGLRGGTGGRGAY